MKGRKEGKKTLLQWGLKSYVGQKLHQFFKLCYKQKCFQLNGFLSSLPSIYFVWNIFYKKKQKKIKDVSKWNFFHSKINFFKSLIILFFFIKKKNTQSAKSCDIKKKSYLPRIKTVFPLIKIKKVLICKSHFFFVWKIITIDGCSMRV